MASGADMDSYAIMLWVALGLIACAMLLVGTLIGFIAQFRTVKAHSEDTESSTSQRVARPH